MERKALYEKEGVKIFFKTDPLCVLVLTPLAQRAHTLPMAKEIVFSDTTSSCDAGHHAVTFLHTPCAAGAAPLGVFITQGQSEEVYKEAFLLLKNEFPAAFNGEGLPKFFMTDHSQAEMNAIQAVWPLCTVLLCIFHVLQAVWRWLWESKHNIPENKRVEYFNNFKNILHAPHKNGANEMYENCISCEQEFPGWVQYVKYNWQLKEKWCLCYRDHQVRGSHTNNFSESAIRVMKDQVLSRVKAFNLISLIDFVCTALEKVYTTRFTEFSNFRQRQSLIFFKRCLKKTAYLKKSDIEQLDESLFFVKSEQDPTKYYLVNIEVGSCTCPAGEFGKFCKHECAVYHHFNVRSNNFPAITAQDRQLIFQIAVGKEKCPKIDFFEDFQTADSAKDSAIILNASANAETDSLLLDNLNRGEQVSPFETIIENSEQPNQYDEVTSNLRVHSSPKKIDYFAVVAEKFVKKINDFKAADNGYINGILKQYCNKLDQIKSIGQLENLLLGLNKKRYKAGAKIRVQPTSIARRRPGLTRGSKRQRSGRPPKDQPGAKKRKHNLSQNVQSNVRN